MKSLRTAALTLACIGIATVAGARTITGYTNVTCVNMPMSITNFNIPIYSDQVLIKAPSITVPYWISGATHWTSNNTYVLMGQVYVTNGATLTIDPGTVIRGWPYTDPTASRPGMLLVTKGGQIYARGTNTNPIIFTDMWDNNVPGMTAGPQPNAPYFKAGQRDYSKWQPAFGYWGGLLIAGKCPIAKNDMGRGGPNVVPNAVCEGVPDEAGTHYGDGPFDDDDSSGVLTYISIRYNGYGQSTGTLEINGLSLYAVGRGTEIHHIEIMNTTDDAVEWFGGTVNTKYLFAFAYGDDGLDSDEGYRGKSQFDLCVQGALQDVINNESSTTPTWVSVVGSAFADKGMEIDASTGAEQSQPLAQSVWYNITSIGKGPTNGLEAAIAQMGDQNTVEGSDQIDANTAIICRDNAGPQIYNSIFTDFRGAGILIEARTDKVYSAYSYDCLTRCKTDYDDFPVNGTTQRVNVSGVLLDNAYLYKTQVDGKQLEIRDNVFYNMMGKLLCPTDAADLLQAAGYENAGTAARAKHIDIKGYSAIDVDFSQAQYSNVVAVSSPIMSLQRDLNPNSDLTAKRVYAVTNIDPRPVAAYATSDRTPPSDGFFTPVSYRGAFSDVQSSYQNWLKGWTLADSWHLVTLPDPPSAAIDVVDSAPAFYFSMPVVGSLYKVYSSANAAAPFPASWTLLDNWMGDGTGMWYVDTRLPSQKPVFFRVEREDPAAP